MLFSVLTVIRWPHDPLRLLYLPESEPCFSPLRLASSLSLLVIIIKKHLIFSCTAHVDILFSFFQNHPPHEILYHPSKRRPGLLLKSQALWATLASNQTPSFIVVVLSSRKARSGRVAVSPVSELAVICRVSFLEHSTHRLVVELCTDTVPLK